MKVDCTVRQAIWLAGVLGTVLILIFLTGYRYQLLVFDENGPVQIATAMLFLVGVVVAALGWVRTEGQARFYFATWSLLCLIFFGEETSWLQHQLGYSTPEFVATRNVKSEFNLHNLNIFHGGELLGSNEDLRSSLLKSQHLFQLGFFAYFFVLPAATLIRPTRAFIYKLQVPFPGGRLFGCIWLTVGLSILLTLVAGDIAKPLIAETRELVYAVSVLVFLSLWFAHQRHADQPI